MEAYELRLLQPTVWDPLCSVCAVNAPGLTEFESGDYQAAGVAAVQKPIDDVLLLHEDVHHLSGTARLVGAAGALCAFVTGNVAGPVHTPSPRDKENQLHLAMDGEMPTTLVASPLLLINAHKLLAPAMATSPPPDSSAAAAELANGSTLTASTGEPPVELPPSACWWALRCCVLRQRLLQHHTASLWTCIEALAGRVVALPLPDSIRVAALLEVSLAYQLHGYLQAAQQFLQQAQLLCGVELSLIGQLGVRTAHQAEAKPQLVLKVTAVEQNCGSAVLHGAGEVHANGCSASKAQQHATEQQRSSEGNQSEQGSGTPEAATCKHAVNDRHLPLSEVIDAELLDGDSSSAQPPLEEQDILPLPVLEGAEEALEQLDALQQALVLVACTLVKKGTAADELRGWEMAPYTEAVLAQHYSLPAVRAAARLLRARHDRTRNRTKMRALMTYEALLGALQKQYPTNTAGGHDRGTAVAGALQLPLALAVSLPLYSALRREAAEEMVACGLVGEALDVFEDLELWDNLITCYRLLGKVQAAEDLVVKRLQVTPTDPRLWCALGDLRVDDGCYRKALEVSDNRSGQAYRALARAAMARKDFAQAEEQWRAALQLNPLHAQGWFALGYASLKLRLDIKALQAFSRSAQLDPDNAEAWNNMAAIHLQLGSVQEAYSALGEALKQRRDNWQMWANYAHIACQTAHWQQAVHAVGKVFQLTQGSQLLLDTLQAVLLFLGSKDQHAAAAAGEPGSAVSVSGSSTEAEHHDGIQQHGNAAVPCAAHAEAVDGLQNSGVVAAELDALVTGSNEEPCGRQQQEEIGPTDKRAREAVDVALQGLLKAAAGSSHASPAFWELYAAYHKLHDNMQMARECLMKALRGLQGGHWVKDSKACAQVARVCCELATVVSAGVEHGELQPRDASSIRLQLRSLLKAEVLQEHPSAAAQVQTQLQAMEELLKTG